MFSWMLFGVFLSNFSIFSLKVLHHLLPFLRLFHVSHFLVIDVQSERTVRRQNMDLFGRFKWCNVVHSLHFYIINIKVSHPVSCYFCQLLDFLVVFYSLEVFPLRMMKSLCERVWYFKYSTYNLSSFNLFTWLIDMLLVFTVRKFTQNLIFLFKNIDFTGIFVSSTPENQPTNFEILTICCVFCVSLQKMNINGSNVLRHGCVQSHLNRRIMTSIALVFSSLDVKRADGWMMRSLFKTETDSTNWTLISLP